MIKVSSKGDFKKTIKLLNSTKQNRRNILAILNHYGRIGAEALAESTPIDTGKTARSWDYTIEESNNSLVITWTNSNIQKGINIAMLIQKGHGTRNGGYVQGRDYINPAILPIFDKIAEEVSKEINSV